ncbi:MAG: erythromycin esterase family protein [Planctomycetes bacterium]|nr:erythromycin esterase family protein [Planctomycetota bacterium]
MKRNPSDQIVLWGHNGHITNGPLRWMGIEALDSHESRGWLFRRYRHEIGPKGSIGRAFIDAGVGDCFLDLRQVPPNTEIQNWLNSGHGIRSWGGYRIPENPDSATRNADTLMQIVPSEDFDGLLFLKNTSAAMPVDASRIWPPSEGIE